MENKDFYLPRLFDETLKQLLRRKGAVVVVGPKWCGKTTTCERLCLSKRDLLPSDTRGDLVALAKVSPTRFLDGDKPMLIDEWQHISFLWDDIKGYVDKAHSTGLFILTGSVTDSSIMGKEEESEASSRHTGTGRIVKAKMRPMSLLESKDGDGTVSLSSLVKGDFAPGISKLGIEDYAYLICRGGWPMCVRMEKEDALGAARDYFEMVVSEDIFSLKAIPLVKDEQKARKLLRSYARNVSTTATNKTIKDDVLSLGDTLDEETFQKYLLALRDLYVIEELEAWNPYLRSRVAIRSKPTRHFVDPSIAAASLGVGPDGLFSDMTTFGLLFESLAIRDLRIYAESSGAKVYKYRDAKNREADAVIQWGDGSFALIEVKLGGKDDVEEAAKKLLLLSNDIDQKKTGKLSFLMVITKGPTAYRREDGVYVVPLGSLCA